MLLSKFSGITSFSSLGAVKKVFRTGKVGHTGTLDSFAEGLLVVLVGKLTRLAPFITATDKTYQAVVHFGRETDTLEITGQEIARGAVPSRQQLEEVLPQFVGTISQRPPEFSALHVGGKRASDLVREGKSVEMPLREVTINSIALKDFCGEYALLEVSCSKGTYIRSLARDISHSLGTCGYLAALRRTGVGPFVLDQAVFAEKMSPFTVDSRGISQREQSFSEEDYNLIEKSLIEFTPSFATQCNLSPVTLKNDFLHAFMNGKPLKKNWFINSGGEVYKELPQGYVAVFSCQGAFVGMIEVGEGRITYCFVVPSL